MAVEASVFLRLGFILIPVVVAALFALGAWRVGGARLAVGAGLGVAAWASALAAIAAGGVLARFDARPPPLMLFLLACIATGIGVGTSSLGARLAQLPLSVLVGAQAFRLPLEFLMHRAATEGVMPVQMSFGGCNFDIVTGSTAALLALLLAVGRAPLWLVAAWNALGMTLLLVIGVVAASSTPVFAAFGSTPDRLNTFVAYFPYVWLPGILVVAALMGHIVVLRRLRAERRVSAAQPRPA